MVRKKVIKKSRKNVKKMEREVKLILGGIGAITLLLAGIIVVLTVDFGPEEKPSEPLPEPEKYSNLYIDEVRFVNSKTNTRADADDHKVEATVYFTNDGDATAKDVELDIFALVTETNMAEDSDTVKVGDVDAMKTMKATFSLDLPVGEEYKIDLLVFEDGMIIKKGFGTVKLEDRSMVSAQQFKTTYGDNDVEANKGPNVPSGDYDDDDDTISGSFLENGISKEEESTFAGLLISLICVIVIVIILTVVWIVKKKRRSKNESQKSSFYLNKTPGNEMQNEWNGNLDAETGSNSSLPGNSQTAEYSSEFNQESWKP